MDIKIPPQNLEAERAVIGAILLDENALNKVVDILKPEFFYEPRHSLFFEHILKLYVEGRPIDILTLTNILKKSNKLKQSGGGTYLSEIVSSVPTSANIVEYATIVKEKAVRRNLITFGGTLTEIAGNETEELEKIMDTIEQNVLSISQDNTKKDFQESGELLEQYMQRADEYAKNPNALRGLPTGLDKLDGILGGLHKSDLIILAARPSVGKSAFVFYMARHIAVNASKTVAIFSLEMPALQVMERMLAQQMETSLWELRMGKLSKEHYKKYPEAAGKLGDSNILIDETPGINIMQLKSKARKLMIEKGLDLIVIDYLQLMQGRSIDNRAQEVGEISRSLKILARELGVPIIALSQLNRAVENRNDRIPQLSDLRESGSIEQDADIVMFLSREMTPDEDENSDKKKVDIYIAKHRNGPIGKVSVDFISSQQVFKDGD